MSKSYTDIYPNDPKVRDAVLDELRVKPWLKPSETPYTLTNARIIDTVNGKVLDGTHSITIKNGVIASISADGQGSSAVVDEGTRIDVGGKFVSPGLIDAHVHVTAVPGVNTMADMTRLPDQVTTLRSTYVLKGMLHRGFTTVRDTGGASKFLADALKEQLIEGPRLFQCGKALSQTGGHADYVPVGQPGMEGASTCCGGHGAAISLGRVVDGVPACLKATREELKAGADFIKIMMGGGVSSEYDPIEAIQYSPEEVRAITSTAWQMGKKMCTAHAYTCEAIRHAVDNGVMGIEHGNLIDEPTARMMAEKGIYLTPTLSCYGIMVRDPFGSKFLNDEQQVKNAEVMQMGLKALKIADEAGVTICYGSDMLISMHALQTEEFTVRSKVLSPATILRHATINPAKMLRQEGKLGVVAAGAIADLLVLDKNPLDDITVFDRPELYLKAIFKEGRLVTSSL